MIDVKQEISKEFNSFIFFGNVNDENLIGYLSWKLIYISLNILNRLIEFNDEVDWWIS